MISTLSRLLSGFFAWWFAELTACVPARLREVLRPSRPALLIFPEGGALRFRLRRRNSCQDLGEVAGEPQDPQAMRPKLEALLRGIPVNQADVVVLVPESRVLRRRLTLPLAAAENLREVLSFELDRHTPFPAEEAAFDYRIVATDRETQELIVDLVVAAKALPEEAAREAATLGLPVTRVDIADRDGAEQGWNLLRRATDETGSSLLKRLNFALGAAVCGLLVFALWLPLERKQRELAAYEARLIEVRGVAAEVEDLRGTIVATTDRQQFLSRHRAAVPMAIAVLDEVTRRLPDDTWASDLRLNRKELLLAGFAPAAATLIPLLENSQLFRDVRFGAPVTPDPRTNLERFNLAMAIGAGTEKE